MYSWLWVGIGGFLGAVARYGLSQWVYKLFLPSFPLGTLIVNVVGSFWIGVFHGMVEWWQWGSPQVRLLLLIGFWGSFTTFSTFTYELLALLRDHRWWMALGYGGLHLVLGFVAVLLGFELVKFGQ